MKPIGGMINLDTTVSLPDDSSKPLIVVLQATE